MSHPLPGSERECPSCGSANVPTSAYCAQCGAHLRAAVAPQPGGSAAARGPDWDNLKVELSAGFRRYWPGIILIGLMALFDYRLKGDAWFTILAGGGASLALLLVGRLKQFLEPVLTLIPQRFVGPALTAGPAALLYLVRWKGTQSDGSALLTCAVIIGFSFAVAANRDKLNERLGPFFEARNRLLPRAVRFILVAVVPVFLTFLLVHRDLSDIGALLGGTTSSPRAPSAGNTELMIVLSAIVSAAVVFLLLNEPPPPRDGSSSAPGRPNA